MLVNYRNNDDLYLALERDPFLSHLCAPDGICAVHGVYDTSELPIEHDCPSCSKERQELINWVCPLCHSDECASTPKHPRCSFFE